MSLKMKFVDFDSSFVQWIEISKNIVVLNDIFLLGCTYIPHEFSKYSSEESFCEIKDRLIKFSKELL